MFSKSCQYALQAILYIALHAEKGHSVGLKDIAASQSIPLHYLSKILQTLVKHKILWSTKGPSGGFSLALAPSKIKLIRVVEAIDGLDTINRCGIGLRQCSDENPCPIHEEYKKIKEITRDILHSKSLASFVAEIREGKSLVTL